MSGGVGGEAAVGDMLDLGEVCVVAMLGLVYKYPNKDHRCGWCYGLNCIPPNSCVEVLIPRISEHDYI